MDGKRAEEDAYRPPLRKHGLRLAYRIATARALTPCKLAPPSSIAVDPVGNLLSTGSFGGTVDFDPTDGVDLRSSNGEVDVFVTKLGPDGSYAWTRTVGGTDIDAGSEITTDAFANVFVTGKFVSAVVDFDPTAGVDQQTSNGQGDIFISKLSPDGSYGWTGTIGGSLFDWGSGLTVSPDGSVLFTGAFEGFLNPRGF